MLAFQDLSIPDRLKQSLDKINFIDMTKIQSQAMPILMEGQDLIACSETGSGKTGAYAIPMMARLMEDPDASGLILAPTRELAQQIAEFIDKLTPDVRQFNVVKLVGGSDIRKQFKSLQKKPRVIIATPGRLIDHLKRNTVQIHKTKILVLDEGDRMIDMGFAPQLQQILKYLPEERQTSFFTATLDEGVQKLANQYLNKPKKIVIGEASRPVSAIKQSVRLVELPEKDECILNELNTRQGSVIVFLKTQHRVDRLAHYLADFGVSVDQIHGGRTQGQRNRAIQNFKSGKIRVLCATDIAARGLDVPHVEHVINFDLPMQDEDYVHRIGRTARNGAEGEALTFVMKQEYRAWNRLVKKFQIKNLLLPEWKPSDKKSSGRSAGFAEKRGKKFGASSDFKKKPFGDRGPRRRFEDEESQPRERRKKSFDSSFERPRQEKSEFSRGKKKFGGEKQDFSERPRQERRGFSDRTQGEKRDFTERPRSEKGGRKERSFSSEKRGYGERSSSEKREFSGRGQGEKRSFSSDRAQGEGRRSEGASKSKKSFGGKGKSFSKASAGGTKFKKKAGFKKKR